MLLRNMLRVKCFNYLPLGKTTHPDAGPENIEPVGADRISF